MERNPISGGDSRHAGAHAGAARGFPSPRRRGLARTVAALALATGLAAAAAAPVAADEYDDKRSGHPLRIVAYVLHPVGVILDRVIFRPAHWLGHHEPLRTLFGHEDD